MKNFELEEYFLEPLERRRDLPEQRFLGTEYENFILVSRPHETLKYQPLPMNGKPGVYHLLETIHEIDQQRGVQWEKKYENDKLIGLLNQQKQSITVEPGGQIEFAGAPLASLEAVQKELLAYYRTLSQAVEIFNGKILSFGVVPLYPLEMIPLVDKLRYHVMFPYMKTVGNWGQWMMKASAATQVSIDFFSKEDLERKFVFLNRISPFLTAVFANSPLLNGSKSEYLSFRGRIWQDTDPDRSGLPESFLQENFKLNDYIQWALKASPYFLNRDGKDIFLAETSFEKLIAGEKPEIEVSAADWKEHLGMLFPDVRIKQIMEVRAVDGLMPRDSIAVPTLIKALIYNKDAFEKVYSILMDLPSKNFSIYRAAAAKEGLHAEVNGLSFAKFARQFFEIALSALGSAEENWLLPFFEKYTKDGFSPADLVLKKFEAADQDIVKWVETYFAESSLDFLES
ncbi:MAG: glutamate--cysteine ligase [SAR324 cluster bacterium]|nr:glutamate--cysteine ligase [SAR324 cluster bacterium]